ncbi:MAG: hypothetical protein K1X75_12675 [Leptospirales bacterium]|nr:hypothetical protein [Leptospirales bacterium]
MNAGGWLIMLTSVGFVTALFVWSMALTLRRKDMDRHPLHSTRDEPPDLSRD